MARALCRARLRRRRGDPSVLHGLVPRVRNGGAHRSSVRRRSAATAPPPGSTPSARPAASPSDKVDAAKNRVLPAIAGALAKQPIKGRITLSGYEGSELLVARLLIESGADLRYVGTACPRTRLSDADREWLEAKGVASAYRASLEQDFAAVEEFQPDLAIGTTPVVQKAKQMAIPALYFTNLISARPLMGAGRRRLARARWSMPRSPPSRASTR